MLKKVFFDTEFTRSGQNTTLVSIGLVSESGEELYLELSDYDQTQVTPWLRDHILTLLSGKDTVTRLQARDRLTTWFNSISEGGELQLISAGRELDNVLLYDVWAEVKPDGTLRTWQDLLPAVIAHKHHLDLDTALSLCGVDPTQDRDSLVQLECPGRRHHALYDAHLIKACWSKYIEPKLNLLKGKTNAFAPH